MPAETTSTLFQRIWDRHIVAKKSGQPAVLYVDLHLIHEVTSPQAFATLDVRGLRVRRADKTVATMDHSVPTLPKGHLLLDSQGANQLKVLEDNCRKHGIVLYPFGSEKQGIVHVIGPELGLTLPGMTIVCGDSHTATHGAFGTLAFGIGTSEVAHVLATQCLLQEQPRTLNIHVTGRFKRGVSAKDLIVAIVTRLGVGGGAGFVIEYTGPAITALDMEGRMTVCNMSIEAGARAGMIGPDDTTFQYLSGREFAPNGAAWDRAVTRWRGLNSGTDARFDKSITLSADALSPMITYGTNPAMAIGVTEPVPSAGGAGFTFSQEALEKALHYMDIEPGKPLLGHKVDVVFIGSCTNGRLSDLRSAAQIFRRGRVANGVRTLIVPGSREVKRQAEAEGLDRIFREAGAEWREPGCSMCIAMNGDELRPGQYAVSTSNRNFEGRQGQGGRTFLASPWTAAASAVEGRVADARTHLE